MQKKKLEELKQLYIELYSLRNEFEQTDNQKYAFAPCMIGSKYGESKIRLMIYGQNANGWPTDRSQSAEEFADNYVNSLFNGQAFDWILLDEKGEEWNGMGYYPERHAFWRMQKMIFLTLTKGEELKYRIWQDYIVQSDTLKITYEDSGKGNVKSWRIKRQRELCLKILFSELEIVKPTHLLFMTNDKEYCFEEIIKLLHPYHGKYVKHTGYLFDAKTVIARHPQYTSPEVYLAECIDAFDHL